MFPGQTEHPLNKQWYLGSFFKIPLYIHFVLVIYLAFELLLAILHFNFFRLFWPLALFLAVYAHELGHALTSAKFGIKPRRIVLHLFGGIAEIPPGLGLREELFVIAAGPAVSGVSALLSLIAAKILGHPTTFISWLFYFFFYINLILFIFNILPIYPLDGGQFLRQYLTLKRGKNEAIRRTLPLSMLTLILAGLISIIFWNSLGGPYVFALAIILLFLNHQEWLRWHFLFRGRRGFWGYINPFYDSLTLQKIRAQIFIWLYGGRAKKIMKKSDQVGLLNLSPEEREILDRYLDAKAILRQKNNYLH